MKNIIKTILLFTALSISSSVSAQITKAEIRATGLTCSMCSNAINKQLKKIDAVDNVTTDLNTNTFTVYLKNYNTVSPKIFKESVENAGFFIGSLEITIPANQIESNDNYILTESKDLKNKDLVTAKVLDKGYVTDKEYKKLLKSFSKSATYSLDNEDDFHLKLVN